jgi:DNA-binding MarR family transcriptional regulator
LQTTQTTKLLDGATMDLAEEVLIALRQIIRAIDLHSRYLVKNVGLTGPQLFVLMEASRSEGNSVGGIASKVSLSQATVTDILDRLELKGLIFRVRSKADRRRMTVGLTAEGEKILRSHPSLFQEQFLSRFDELEDWEKTSILSSLQRVAAMMRADVISAPPVLDSGSIPKMDEKERFFLSTEEPAGSESTSQRSKP